MTTTRKITTNDGIPMKNLENYRSLVRALQYLTFTHPNISFAVNQVCQFMHDPREIHLKAVKRILRYIKGTITNGLFFSIIKKQPKLVAYSYTDWEGDLDTRGGLRLDSR